MIYLLNRFVGWLKYFYFFFNLIKYVIPSFLGYIGRVQMKVFRGPTSQNGNWAPHGFWVRQPADPDN